MLLRLRSVVSEHRSSTMPRSRTALYRAVEYVFLGVFACYLLFYTHALTTFKVPLSSTLEGDLLVALTVATLAKVVALLWAQPEARFRNLRLLFAAACVGTVYHLVYFADGYMFLEFLVVATVGMVGTDYRRVLKIGVCVVGVMVAAAVVGALAGAIDNLVYLRGGAIRSAWGISYPTDYAALVTFLCIGAWLAWDRAPYGIFVACGVVSLLNAHFIAGSRTGVICSAAFIVVVLACRFARHRPARGAAKAASAPSSYAAVERMRRSVVRALRMGTPFVFPVIAILTLVMVTLYAMGFPPMFAIDRIVSGRLRLALDAYREYGFSLFGIPFALVGNGGSTLSIGDYNFVDNSYALIFLRYGVVLLVVLGILWYRMGRKAIELGDWRLALGLALIAFNSASEHHFVDLRYNLLIVLPFAVLSASRTRGARSGSRHGSRAAAARRPGAGDVRRPTPRTRGNHMHRGGNHGENTPGAVTTVSMSTGGSQSVRRHRPGGAPRGAASRRESQAAGRAGVIAAFVTCGLFGSALVLVGPRVFSQLRTSWDLICKAQVLMEGRRLATCVFLMLCVVLVVLAFYAVHGTITAFLRHVRPPVVCLCCLLGISLFGVGTYRAYRSLVEDHREVYAETIEADRAAVGVIKHACKRGGGRFFATEVPILYQQTLRGFSQSFFYGDDLARLSKVTVMVDADHDAPCFFGRGFLYTEISQQHAVYTNDEDVIAALGEAGYHLTGYFSRVNRLYLKKLAELNKLDRGSTGAIILRGEEESIDWSDKITLREGPYTVTYEISLPAFTRKLAKDGEIELGYLEVLRGTTSLAKKPLYRSQFVKDEVSSIPVAFRTRDARNIHVHVHANGEYKLLVHRISYCRTPESDVHTTYDDQGRRVREMYYDLEGAQFRRSDGSYGSAYEYDGKGNVELKTYLGKDGEPAVVEDGYARIGYRYDLRGRCVREEYRDVEGDPVETPSGYAVVEYEYDEAGNRSVFRYFDADGEPAVLQAGYSAVKKTLDDKKRVVGEAYLDGNGDPVMVSAGYASYTCTYDEEGNEATRCLFGVDGQPIVGANGYAEVHRDYDPFGRVIYESFYGTDGGPLPQTYGQCAMGYEYDTAGNRVETRFYDGEGRPFLVRDTYFRLSRVFNDEKKVIREAYYGADENPVELPEGYHALERHYDDAGNNDRIVYLDQWGEVTTRKEGYAILLRYYDDWGSVVHEEYCDGEGGLMMIDAGYAMKDTLYNESGKEAERRFLDLDYQLTTIRGGYAFMRFDYDDVGRLVRESYYDVLGNPVNTSGGYASQAYEYDESGQRIQTQRYDVEGNAVERV